ncbi:MAG: alcohol dehydrogenase catalytic domain-containing protein [Pseudomonadota bacterium]
MKMRAALFFGPSDIRLETVDIPTIGPGEVLIKVGTALTCGTDFKAYRQGHPVLLGTNLPAPFGHELAGTIATVGRGVTHFKEGMRVVAANSAPCDRCYFCQHGKPNLCDNLKLLNGAYAEYIRIPAQIVKHNLYEIPDNVSFKAAALTEPLACAVHAFERLQIRPIDSVVILGCGIMGLLFCNVAKIRGVDVIAVGRNPEKLSRAKTMGIRSVVDVADLADPSASILAETPENRGADFVVEVVGRPEAWEQAFRLVRKGGTVCLFGGCKKGSSYKLDTHRAHYEEVSVVGVFHHTPIHFAQALQYVVDGKVPVDLFITSELRLEEIPSFFRTSVDASPFKAAVIP